jgi:hypothetical protein
VCDCVRDYGWNERTLRGGAQYGSAPAKAALARFDTLAPGDPEDAESFVAPRAKAVELVEAALKSAGKLPGSEGYDEIKEEQAEKVLTVRRSHVVLLFKGEGYSQGLGHVNPLYTYKVILSVWMDHAAIETRSLGHEDDIVWRKWAIRRRC